MFFAAPKCGWMSKWRILVLNRARSKVAGMQSDEHHLTFERRRRVNIVRSNATFVHVNDRFQVTLYDNVNRLVTIAISQETFTTLFMKVWAMPVAWAEFIRG